MLDGYREMTCLLFAPVRPETLAQSASSELLWVLNQTDQWWLEAAQSVKNNVDT